jgi:hypothetical protein
VLCCFTVLRVPVHLSKPQLFQPVDAWLRMLSPRFPADLLALAVLLLYMVDRVALSVCCILLL